MGKIAHGGIGFGAPDPVSWAIIESLARKFALNVGDELGLIASLDRRRRLGGLQARWKRYFVLQQWPSGENRRRVRALLQKQGIGNDRKRGKCRHDDSNKFAGLTANRSRHPTCCIERICLSARPSRHFFDPIVCGNWDADLNVPHATDRDEKSSAPLFAPRGAQTCRHNSKPARENSRSRLTSCRTDAPLVRANLRSKALKRKLRPECRKGQLRVAARV